MDAGEEHQPPLLQLTNAQSKHETEKVNARREMVRLALQKKKVENIVEQERAKRLLAQRLSKRVRVLLNQRRC